MFKVEYFSTEREHRTSLIRKWVATQVLRCNVETKPHVKPHVFFFDWDMESKNEQTSNQTYQI